MKKKGVNISESHFILISLLLRLEECLESISNSVFCGYLLPSWFELVFCKTEIQEY